jgi:hypothetical protein
VLVSWTRLGWICIIPLRICFFFHCACFISVFCFFHSSSRSPR